MKALSTVYGAEDRFLIHSRASEPRNKLVQKEPIMVIIHEERIDSFTTNGFSYPGPVRIFDLDIVSNGSNLLALKVESESKHQHAS